VSCLLLVAYRTDLFDQETSYSLCEPYRIYRATRELSLPVNIDVDLLKVTGGEAANMKESGPVSTRYTVYANPNSTSQINTDSSRFSILHLLPLNTLTFTLHAKKLRPARSTAMARVSFGSRAGTSTDYLVGSNDFTYHRNSSLNGSYTSIDELTAALRTELVASSQSAVPECTTCELALRLHASLPLLRPIIGPYAEGGQHDLPAEFKALADGSNANGRGPAVPYVSIQTVLSLPSGRTRQIVQRAASRGIMHALESIDGFKYTFNNAWAAKDEEGLRFSYICQDSQQNKDRHANGFTKTQKHLKSGAERGVRKATYDCKGSVAVKFSYIRRCVDIYYRHYAIHCTVAERKAAARSQITGSPHIPTPSSSTNPRPLEPRPLEVEPPQSDTGGLLGTLQAEKSAYAEPTPPQPPASNIGRPLKRKRDTGKPPPPPAGDLAKPLSLFELLIESEDAQARPTVPQITPKVKGRNIAPPVSYDLPAWQTAPQAPSHPYRSQHGSSKPQGSDAYSSPYPPPYRASKQHGQQQAVSTQEPPTQSLQHEPQGLPKPAPRAQGLFTTLKPVAKEHYSVTLEPHFYHHNAHRAKTSCNNCRISKKKVSPHIPHMIPANSADLLYAVRRRSTRV